jgi:hypothetical protein
MDKLIIVAIALLVILVMTKPRGRKCGYRSHRNIVLTRA